MIKMNRGEFMAFLGCMTISVVCWVAVIFTGCDDEAPIQAGYSPDTAPIQATDTLGLGPGLPDLQIVDYRGEPGLQMIWEWDNHDPPRPIAVPYAHVHNHGASPDSATTITVHYRLFGPLFPDGYYRTFTSGVPEAGHNGASFSVHFHTIADDPAHFGWYTAMAVVDATDQVEESNEDNVFYLQFQYPEDGYEALE